MEKQNKNARNKKKTHQQKIQNKTDVKNNNLKMKVIEKKQKAITKNQKKKQK